MSAEATTDERAGILLVDDMEDNLIALEAVLGSLNEPLVRARSGEEAMKALLRQRFALVLLDVRMPGMDGFETATNIKRLDQTKDVPIIFLTGAEDEPGYAFRGYATGAADYLTKPFDPWVLRAKVSVFLDLHRKNQQLERLVSQEAAHCGQVHSQLDEVDGLLAADSPDVPEARRRIGQLRQLVEAIRRGAAAGVAEPHLPSLSPRRNG
jgi:response regulator RpfG family c-di-GMP phosphodiesterase